MRVTIHHQEDNRVILKIEGKLSGPHVPELHRAWEDLASSLGGRRLLVDLCGVTHVDGTGRSLLADIHAKTGAEFEADTPLTKYFAEQAKQEIRTIPEPSAEPRRRS